MAVRRIGTARPAGPVAASILAVLTGAAMLWAASPALAQARCGARADIARQLAEDWGERQAGSGLSAEGRIVELWVSDRSGSWTILIVTAGGMACLAAAGEGWITLPAAPDGEAL